MKKMLLTAAAALVCLALPAPALAVFNGAPSVEGDLYHTYENIAVYGSVRVFDPEGDEVTLSVASSPAKGSVSLDGRAFQYIPYPGARGDDAFTVRATDRYGNRSEEATIAVSIASASSGQPFFCDMDRHPYEYSAIRLAQAGVMGGEAVGARLFFYPDREMTRGAFVVGLLAARGWDADLGVCVNTGLEDDAEIPLWMKPYIRRAIDCGIVTEGAFDTATVPTRAEAVVLTDRAAGIDDILKVNLVLGDREQIPAWAMPSYVNLTAYRMLDLYDGNAYPNAPLDRGWAASLLWQLYQYNKANG